ncbi:hypothetical protein AWB98_27855 [Mycolicibacterium conceptionense]|uniref:DUF3631 domain-containing protein n=1 Tax=Mycolicibacterium conceptionense TaxID=451644 RepID=A0ABX3V067_9MYCO|nr:DUF3631 domain-containing protein [Mycolicibacterium conceptionense]ORV21340.1 hypothetical protein AWB98_27855 [Mycolicibacterium conceptionense]
MTSKLLDEASEMVSKYVAFPSEHHSVVVALWVLHTWVVNAFYVTPRLILDSAEPGSGKTRVLELLALLCRSAKLTLSTTTAALYRRIAAAVDEGLPPPTVLQDEADAIFGKSATPQAEDLRALFNAGYRKGATVDRCEGDAKNMKVREFPVHAPVALAGLAGKMPDTIRTRGVTIHMRRRRPDQKVADFRERDALAEAAPIRESLAQWASEHEVGLADARPDMPDGVTDRSAEIWEPLLAIADLAGGQWPAKARAACRFFVISSASDDERLSLGQRLLRDIKALIDAEGVNAMWSADIISKLTSDPESEWRDLWGKTLDQRRLAKELGKYGVKSKDIRIGLAKNKGYAVDGHTGLGQAWQHWLSPSVSATSETSETLQVSASRTVADSYSTATSATQARHTFTPSEQAELENVADVADVADKNGSPLDVADSNRTLCPDCRRAPARTDTGCCDFCTAKRRRQQTLHKPKLSCAKWFDNYVIQLRDAGETTFTSFTVKPAAAAEDYSDNLLHQAIASHPDVVLLERKGGTTTWSITGQPTGYQPVLSWFNDWLDTLPTNTVQVDKTVLKQDCEAAGHSWESLRREVVQRCPRIESVKNGRSTTWRIVPTTTNDGAAS